MTWFLRGFGKKVLLANNMGAVFDAIAAISPDGRCALIAWIGALAYTMQIYFDFSGYSDMAIGFGKMLGFDFVQSFNYPYISGSVTDFWRRWHISLGSWFREYVYIPLGGNRVSVPKHMRNILIVWILTGFWHGASWNFVLWGLYYGLLLLLEKYVIGRVLRKIPRFFGTIYTMFCVIIGWVVFSADSLGGAISYLGNMLGSAGWFDRTGVYYLTGSLILLLLCLMCATPLVRWLFCGLSLRKGMGSTVFATLSYTVLFLFSLAYLISDTYNPFLYFRF